MRILHISDTHNRHDLLVDLPPEDVIVDTGDLSDNGTEEEVLAFLNWFIDLPYKYKIFITGNHDLCLWDADTIEDLPENVFLLQDRGCEIEGVKFFGLAYNHPIERIPDNIDVLVTHEPPLGILDTSKGSHWGYMTGKQWGSKDVRNRVFEIKPQYHLFGHEHEDQGVVKQDGIVFSNGKVLNDQYQFKEK